MMKKVIALWGKENVGKTETLKLFNDMLIEKYSLEKTEAKGDIRCVHTINGLKVGIETEGDSGDRLLESLKYFNDLGCDVIVCACRSRGDTPTAVVSLSPVYLVSFRGQSEVSLYKSGESEELKLRRRRSNSAMASLILSEVLEAMGT